MSAILPRLSGLRSRLRFASVGEGAFRSLTWAAGGLLAAAFLDWWVLWRVLEGGTADLVGRILLDLAGLVGLGHLLWCRVLRPLAAEHSDDALALRVEAAHGVLGGRLISTVQLQRQLEADAASIASPALVEALVERVEAESAGLDFSRAVPLAPLGRALIVALVACVAVAGLVVWRQEHALVLLRRLALQDAAYPTAVRILALEHSGKAARGDAYPVAVELDAGRSLPAQAWAQVRLGSRTVEVVLERQGGSREGRQRYAGRIPQVLESFTFRVVAGDARWPRWEPVPVAQRPMLADAVFACEYPAYLGMKAGELPAGDVTVPQGTRLRIRAGTTKPCASAELVQTSGGDGATRALAISGGNRLEGEFLAEANTTLSVNLLDVEGLANSEPVAWVVNVVPDSQPVATIIFPVNDRYASRVAEWEVAFTLRDDHGVSEAALVWQVDQPDSESKDPLLAGRVPVALRSGPDQLVEGQASLDFKKINAPTGVRVSYWIEAIDARGAPAGVGRSRVQGFQVVEMDELLRQIEERREQIKDSLAEIKKSQEDLKKETAALAEQARTGSATAGRPIRVNSPAPR